MAISNWNFILFNNDVEVVFPKIDFGNGFYATIYKDWIHLHNSNLGQKEDEDFPYYDDIFGSAEFGKLQIQNSELYLEHNEDYQAIFIFCIHYNNQEKSYSFDCGMGYYEVEGDDYYFLNDEFKKFLKDLKDDVTQDYIQKVLPKV